MNEERKAAIEAYKDIKAELERQNYWNIDYVLSQLRIDMSKKMGISYNHLLKLIREYNW